MEHKETTTQTPPIEIPDPEITSEFAKLVEEVKTEEEKGRRRTRTLMEAWVEIGDMLEDGDIKPNEAFGILSSALWTKCEELKAKAKIAEEFQRRRKDTSGQAEEDTTLSGEVESADKTAESIIQNFKRLERVRNLIVVDLIQANKINGDFSVSQIRNTIKQLFHE